MLKKVLLFVMSVFFICILGCQKSPKILTHESSEVKIGLSWVADFKANVIPEDTQVYLDAVKKVDAIPVLLPQIKTEEDAIKALKLVDAIIMTGGEDVDPTYYNEQPHPKLEDINKARDTSDYLLLKAALSENYPLLGTCRGMQFLNVVMGGTLYQDLPTQNPTNIQHRDPQKKVFTKHNSIIKSDSHLYKIVKSKTLDVNSWHHQAIKDLGKDLKVVSMAPDGIIEAIELPTATFVLGVQYHPEWHVAENENKFLDFFKTLKEYAIKHKNK